MAENKDLFAPPTEDELSQFDDEMFAPPSEQELEQTDTEMGIGEAAVTGFGQGAALGTTPAISGVVGAGMEAIEDVGDILGLTTDAQLREQGFDIKDDKPGLEGLLQAFKESRDLQKAQEAKALEDQPVTTIAANIAGGLTTGGAATGAKGVAAKILPKAESLKDISTTAKLGIAAREGAKAGALAEAGQANIEDPLQAAQDVAESAAGGAIFSAGAVGGMELLKGLAKILPGTKSLATGYKMGKAGVGLDPDKIKDEVKNVSTQLRTDIQKTFRDAGLEKGDYLKIADDLGINVDLEEIVNNTLENINKGRNLDPKTIKKINDFKNLLNYAKGDFDNVDPKYLQKAQKLGVDRLNLKEASLRDAEDVIDMISEYAGDFTKKAKGKIEPKARQMYGAIRGATEEALQDSDALTGSNKIMTNLFSALEKARIKGSITSDSKRIMEEQVDQFRKFLQRGGDVSEIDRERFFQYLKNSSPEFKKTGEYAELLQEGLSLAKQIEDPSTFFSTIRGGTAKVGELAGKAARTKDVVLTQGFKTLQNKTPENLRELGSRLVEKVGDKAKPFIGPLEKAATANDRTRNAILYGLYQQPAFRRLIQDMGEGVTPFDEEE